MNEATTTLTRAVVNTNSKRCTPPSDLCRLCFQISLDSKHLAKRIANLIPKLLTI